MPRKDDTKPAQLAAGESGAADAHPSEGQGVPTAQGGSEGAVDPTPTDCRLRRRCLTPDDPCGPDGPRPYCWETPTEDVYRAAAERYATVAVGEFAGHATGLRAVVESVYAARQPEIDQLRADLAKERRRIERLPERLARRLNL